MANEFGNAGAVSRQVNSASRLANKTLEAFTNGDVAEWEVFYNNTWRDISSDFEWDTTRAGNTILRAIRWDNDGFRSYREDRGLILREKEEDDEEGDGGDPLGEAGDDDVFGGDQRGGARSVLASFGKAAGIGFGATIANETFSKFIQPKLANTTIGRAFSKQPLSPVGKFLSANKLALGFAAYNFITDKESTTQEKLAQTAVNLGVSYLTKRVFGPASFLITPLLGVVESAFEGESVTETASEFAGSLVGRKLGGKATTGLFKDNSLFKKVANLNIKSKIPDTYIQNNRLKSLSDAFNYQQTFGPKPDKVIIQPVPGYIKNTIATIRENNKARIKNSKKAIESIEGLKTLGSKFNTKGFSNGNIFR